MSSIVVERQRFARTSLKKAYNLDDFTHIGSGILQADSSATPTPPR
jgi:hypothetical protein